MMITPGQVGVVTGAASGIGLAMANAFAQRGLNLVLADVQEDALGVAAERIAALGAQALAVTTDVSKEQSVELLVEATLERFGEVHVVCNNAGFAGMDDPWIGSVSGWKWLLDVNPWGIVRGIRAFLPHLLTGGHIVNTASVSGLIPAFSPSYDASKHAIVAISEHLYKDMQAAGLPVGVSVLYPGWTRTGTLESDRNWPAELGRPPALTEASEVGIGYARRALEGGMAPAEVADQVVQDVESDRFWIIPDDQWLALAAQRWQQITAKSNPAPFEQVPGMPSV